MCLHNGLLAGSDLEERSVTSLSLKEASSVISITLLLIFTLVTNNSYELYNFFS